MDDYSDPGYGYEQQSDPQPAAPATPAAYQPPKQHANLGEAMYGIAPQAAPAAAPQRPHLTTGPITWDQNSIAQAQAQQPGRQMLQYWPGFGLMGALGISPLVARGIMAALRDPRLEMMFRK